MQSRTQCEPHTRTVKYSIYIWWRRDDDDDLHPESAYRVAADADENVQMVSGGRLSPAAVTSP